MYYQNIDAGEQHLPICPGNNVMEVLKVPYFALDSWFLLRLA